MFFPGYEIEEKLESANRFDTYRAVRISDGQRILLKTVRLEVNSQTNFLRMRREFDFSRRISASGLISVLDLFDTGEHSVLVLKDPGGYPLKRAMQNAPLKLSTSLNIAIQLSTILSALHRQGVTHRDVQPFNIYFDDATGVVHLGGLGFASQIPRQLMGEIEADTNEESLSYMSPEQTGWTGRMIDYRTDFYSLGATVFEMITGQLPFQFNDPLKLIHAHVAMQPPAPSNIYANVPEAISSIILKLIAKQAEDRYQSGYGVSEDLMRCLHELESTGTIHSFVLGTSDLPDRFELPQQLYGRDEEFEKLIESFEAASKGTPCVQLVTGNSGIGKSSLIQRLRWHVLKCHGHFVAGKYTERESSTPYSGLIEAARNLVQRILGEDPDMVANYKRQLSEALGPNLGVMTEIIIELEALVGKQQPAPPLAPADEKRRFHFCMQRFIGVFATKQHPLVMFLDDLHWSDPSSVELIVGFMDKSIGSCLLVCAYRENDAGNAATLTQTLKEIRHKGIVIETLRLHPLTPDDVKKLVADAERCDPDQAAILGDLIYRKTAGNPYFVRTFLESLHEEGILSHDDARGRQWDLSQVAAKAATENVAELTARKVNRLAEQTLHIISMAAALGHRFDAATLCTVCELTIDKLRPHLIEACRERVLFKNEQYYQFEHDQVQECAYLLMPIAERPQVHLRIGRLLLGLPSEPSAPGRVFEIVNHLNQATSLITDPPKRQELARLNLRAGRKAKAASTFETSFQFLLAGIALLDDGAWQKQYELTLMLHNEAVHAAYLVGNLAELDRLADLVQQHARTIIDQVPAYESQIFARHACHHDREGLAIAHKILALLGVKPPQEPTQEQVVAAVQKAQCQVERMLNLDPSEIPLMTDPAKSAALRLLVGSVLATTWFSPPLYAMHCCLCVDLTIRYGHSPEAALAFGRAASIISLVLNDYESAYRVGNYSMVLSKRPESVPWRAHCLLIYNLFANCWKVHFNTLLEEFAEVYRLGMGNFDLIAGFAGAGAHSRCLVALNSGLDLYEVKSMVQGYQEKLARFGTKTMKEGLRNAQRMILMLQGQGTGSDQRPSQNEPDPFIQIENSTDHDPTNFILRESVYGQNLTLSVLFRRHDIALKTAREAARFQDNLSSGLLFADYYVCLALIGRNPAITDDDYTHNLTLVEERLVKVRLKAKAAPMNYQHKLDLIEAEMLRAKGQHVSSIVLYDKAIVGARQNGYKQDEGLANELAAEACLECCLERLAALYLWDAATAYGKWGATEKVHQLYKRYPQSLLRPLHQVKTLTPLVGTDINQLDRVGSLDVRSIERAANALSEELELPKLLQRLMEILLQNAGAQRGLLLWQEGGDLFIEASGSVDKDKVQVIQRLQLESCNDLSRSIVRYVSRSHDSVVLGDATSDERFAGDPYIEREKLKSVHCSPILHRGKLVSILYLENNLIHNAFNEERLSALRLISSQAATALENARLHESMKVEINIRRHTETELREALEEVAQLKNQLEAENIYLQEEIQSFHDFQEIVGQSEALKLSLHKIGLVADTDTAVLILGETGTGKELVARAIHALSSRKNRPLVKVNCAALPSTLIESELFGHEKGSFTGAIAKKIGRFELADGGSIFLDEIGDLPLDLQAKLLRVLQEGEFERLGSNVTQKVDVRLIAATNRDLETSIEKGGFRSDLYYRLSVFPIEIPPLRKRSEDIPLLVWHFIAKKQSKLGKAITKVPSNIMGELTAYNWPGNIRELENVIERAIILSPGHSLVVEEPFVNSQLERPEVPRTANMKETERAHILGVLDQCGWKIKGIGNAAELLGLKPSTLRTRMNKLLIKRPGSEST